MNNHHLQFFMCSSYLNKNTLFWLDILDKPALDELDF